MFESPIKIYTMLVDQLNSDVDNQIENAVLTEITKIGINIDKEELIKALNFDRKQYEKGYLDGKSETKYAHWYFNNDSLCLCCSNCNSEALYMKNSDTQTLSDYCPDCGYDMSGSDFDE